MRRKSGRRIASIVWASFLALVLISASACGGDEDGEDAQTAASDAAPAVAIRVVTTSNIVADWAKAIGGGHVEVVSLMPVDVDPHTFQPGPRDAAQIAEADLVLAIGLEMEGFWLQDLLRNVARDPGIVLALGDVIHPDPIVVETMDEEDAHDESEDEHADDEEGAHDDDEDEHADDEEDAHDDDEDEHADDEGDAHDDDEDEHADEDEGEHADDEDDHADDEDEHAEEAEDGHAHGLHNPHFWFDPIRVMSAVDAIAARFAELDPANADVYRANAAAYNQELEALHTWTEQQVSVVAPERRLLLTSHDSFRYFADRYGFEVVGVILGVTSDVEASAEHLAHLVELMKERDVRAVFGETITSERLASTLANEAGATLVRLYSDSLGAEGSDAETYIAMVRTNVERVVEALR